MAVTFPIELVWSSHGTQNLRNCMNFNFPREHKVFKIAPPLCEPKSATNPKMYPNFGIFDHKKNATEFSGGPNPCFFALLESPFNLKQLLFVRFAEYRMSDSGVEKKFGV